LWKVKGSYYAGNVFYFDGASVVMRLVWLGQPVDWSGIGFFRLKAQWKGDTLYWLPPAGKWEELAEFKGGRFVGYHGTYEKATFRDLTKGQLPVLDKRDLYTYEEP
jgi:hypothetical protein